MITRRTRRHSPVWTPGSGLPNGSRQGEIGAAIRGLFALVLILLAAVTAVAFFFGTVVPVGAVGVRKIAFGPGQGLTHKPLHPGFHWTIPGYSEVYEVSQTVQILNFDRDRVRYPDSFGALAIPTVDGTTVEVDAAVLFRFYSREGQVDGVQHGGPVDLINKVGATNVQWRRYLSQVSENFLKRHLSALSTVEFYDPVERQKRVQETEAVMRSALAPFGVEIQSVLLRRYTYREEIDQAIFKKNLQELEMAYNRVASEFAEAQKDVNKVSATGDVRIKNLDKQGVSEVEEVRSKGDLYRRQRIAEADLLVAGARAEVDKLRSDVLSKVGSDVYVALQLAQILSSLKGGVVSNVDPYDFEGWVKRLTGSTLQADRQEAASGSAKANPSSTSSSSESADVR